MSERSLFIQVPSRNGEEVRQKLLDLNLLDDNYKIISEQGYLFLPIKTRINIDEVIPSQIADDVSQGHRMFEVIERKPQTLAAFLQDELTAEEISLLPRAYDLIGDIAVLEIPSELFEQRFEIGKALLQLRPNFVTILGKKGAISGTVRIREYELLAGIDKTDTIHTEYGCRIAVDLSKAYFSPRLLEEHNRIALQVEQDEHVIDMFAGVGPFALHIAKNSKATTTAVDINPHATNLLKESMELNHLSGTIIPVTSSITDYANSVDAGIADRVIMNHPSGAFDFMKEACHLLKQEGKMHYYDFIGGDDPEDALLQKCESIVREVGRKIHEVTLIRRVRDSAPYEYHMVLDAIIS